MDVKHSFMVMLLVIGLSGGSASAAIIGLEDTFEDGTTQGWRINLLGMGTNVNQPINVATGGPAGLDDNYMLMTASGLPGPGGRLVALNPAQWAGDYIAAGITTIRMNVNNFGSTDLHLRLLFEDPMGAPPENEAFTPPVFVPAGSGWTQIAFSIRPASLIPEGGSVALALQNATILRIFSNPDDAGPDEAVPILARLGIDNIEALPEPSSVLLVAAGILGVLGRRLLQR